MSLLGIHARNTDFLGALNAAGQLRGVPAVLLIDAINEGQERRLWHPQLAGILTAAIPTCGCSSVCARRT